MIAHIFFPPGREELLTEHAIAWNRRKIFNLAEALCNRYLKVLETVLLLPGLALGPLCVTSGSLMNLFLGHYRIHWVRLFGC